MLRSRRRFESWKQSLPHLDKKSKWLTSGFSEASHSCPVFFFLRMFVADKIHSCPADLVFLKVSSGGWSDCFSFAKKWWKFCGFSSIIGKFYPGKNFPFLPLSSC